MTYAQFTLGGTLDVAVYKTNGNKQPLEGNTRNWKKYRFVLYA